MGIFTNVFDFLVGSDRPSATWDGPGRNWSHDWCRYRRKSHCHYPEHIHGVQTRAEGRTIFYIKDQGHCPFVSESDQRSCPASEAGILNGDQSDVTVPWDLGGQRLDPSAERAARAAMTVSQDLRSRQTGLIRERAPLSLMPYAPCVVSQGTIPRQFDPALEPQRARDDSVDELQRSRANLEAAQPRNDREREQLEVALARLCMLEEVHAQIHNDPVDDQGRGCK